MTLLYYDPLFMEHQTGDHPESPKRLLPVTRHLSFVGLDAMCSRPSWEPATREQLEAVHTAEYVDRIEQFAASGGGWLDEDTRMSHRSFDVAQSASGAFCDAVTRVMRGEDTNAFCLSRPPGHHATSEQAMGFCLFNHAAVAARWALDSTSCKRVLIVDFDVHHGNGTQDIFYEDPAVGYFSIHRSDFYPQSGHAEETGHGAGQGTTLNVPVARGTNREVQFERFRQGVEQFAEHMQPDLLVVSAGFDGHQDDPVGSLGWHTQDYAMIAKVLIGIAKQHCGNKLVSVLEGGYNPEALSDSVTVYLESMLDA
ncbi:histone deacetylase family protein [Neorhodopirellula lusitana]|nr:histone deacetylase [Neorhodopirellula lusitana]